MTVGKVAKFELAHTAKCSEGRPLYGAGRGSAPQPAVYHDARSRAILCKAGVCRPDMFRQARSARRPQLGGHEARRRGGRALRTLAPPFDRRRQERPIESCPRPSIHLL